MSCNFGSNCEFEKCRFVIFPQWGPWARTKSIYGRRKSWAKCFSNLPVKKGLFDLIFWPCHVFQIQYLVPRHNFGFSYFHKHLFPKCFVFRYIFICFISETKFDMFRYLFITSSRIWQCTTVWGIILAVGSRNFCKLNQPDTASL